MGIVDRVPSMPAALQSSVDSARFTKMTQRPPVGASSEASDPRSHRAGEAGIKTYDFTAMTPKELLETMNGLIRSGQMSLDESSSLVALIPSPLSKVCPDGTMPENFTQPANFFEQLQCNLKSAISRGDDSTAASIRRAQDSLTRFQGKTVKVDMRI